MLRYDVHTPKLTCFNCITLKVVLGVESVVFLWHLCPCILPPSHCDGFHICVPGRCQPSIWSFVSLCLPLFQKTLAHVPHLWMDIVRVNFMCQLVWARYAQTVGKTVFLGLYVGVFPEEVRVFVSGLSEEDARSPAWVGITWSAEAQIGQKGGGRANPLSSWAGTVSISCPSTSELLVLKVSDSRTHTPASPTHFPHPPFLRASDLGWVTSPAFLALQLADSRLWNLSASIIA